MTYRMIYGIIWVPIFFTDRFVPDNMDGLCCGLFILIRPDYKDDRPLLEHELQHCRQCWRTLWLHVPLYFWSRRYRWHAETDAFAVQVRSGGSYRNAVYRIARYYNLGVSEREVEDRLDKKL